MATDDLIADAFLRHQLRLEGTAASMAAMMKREVRWAIDEVERRLEGMGSSFTRSRLVALRGELELLHENLAFRLSGEARALAEGVVGSAPGVLAEAQRAVEASTLTASFARPTEAVLVEVFSRPFEGKSWSAWGRKLARDVADRVGSELARAEALGEGIPAITARLRTVEGLAGSRAEALARTLVTDVGNRARVALVQESFGTLVQGWRYLATLDGRTSKICAWLDGRTWRLGDEEIRRPPLHPSCRSVLVPLTDPRRTADGQRPAVSDTRTPKQRDKDFRRDAMARVGRSRWLRLNERDRRVLIGRERSRWRSSNVGQVSADTDFESWLSRQSSDFQLDYLGPTRFRAFERGLPLEAMATTSRPLAIAELSQRYPMEFAP